METLFSLMKKTRAKKFTVRMFYRLQNLFWGVLAWGVFVQGVFVGGFMSGGVCPDTFKIGVNLQPRWNENNEKVSPDV